jgi:hypothetical protein
VHFAYRGYHHLSIIAAYPAQLHKPSWVAFPGGLHSNSEGAIALNGMKVLNFR